MPFPFHTSIKGKVQTDITKGASDIKGREDTILCQALDHEVYIPHDPQTGRPTGRPVHKAFTITKAYDKSSPKLYQALTTGESLDEVTCKYYRMSGTEEQHYFSIQLKNAIVVSIKNWVPNTLDPSKEQFVHMEDVSFTYEDVYWTWEVDGVAAHHRWIEPKSK